jgi:hypothetical protein
MCHPHHFPAFVPNHNIKRREQVLKFVIRAASSTRLSLSLFILLLSNIVLSKFFSNTAELCPSLNVRNQVSYPYKTRGKVTGARKPTNVQGCCKLLLYSSNYPDMFRQLTVIFRGLHVPRKLLQYCLRLGWLGMCFGVRSVWPAVA